MPLLHPDEHVFAATLEGWRVQQLARNLAVATVGRGQGGRGKSGPFAVQADAIRGGGARRCWMNGWASCEE